MPKQPQPSKETIDRQMKCSHSKDGKPAVYSHAYVSGDEIIGCNLCGMKWRPEDTVEFLVRFGKRVKNHTKRGWREANLLLEELQAPTDKPPEQRTPQTPLPTRAAS